MGTHHDGSASVYRSMPFRAPEAPARDELVEVTTAWGDEVLTVTHLRRGEHLALPYAHIDAAACTVTVPDGATAWVLRDGVCAPRTGDTLTLEAGDCACVLHEGVTLRARRVARPEPLPAPRRLTGFGAAVACALALASTGAAGASELAADDGVVARDDSAARRWIAVHARARLSEPEALTGPEASTAPEAATIGRVRLPNVWPRTIVSFCGCMHEVNVPSAWSPLDPESMRDAFGPFVGLDALGGAPFGRLPAEAVEVSRGPVRASVSVTSGTLPVRALQRVARRHLGELAQCSDGHAPSSVSLRLVVGDGGRVLAAGVTGLGIFAASPEAECVASAVRGWSFPAATRGVSVAEATVTLR
jgi:hypothetical protein